MYIRLHHSQAGRGVPVLGVQTVRQVMNEIEKKDNYPERY